MNKHAKNILLTSIYICALAATVFSQAKTKIDISGKWFINGGGVILITQNGTNVRATFLANGPCPSGADRDYYIEGTINGNGLSGTMKSCTRSEQLRTECKLTDPYTAKFDASIDDQSHIKGISFPDFINYTEKNGHYENCSINPGAGQPAKFSLERVSVKRGDRTKGHVRSR